MTPQELEDFRQRLKTLKVNPPAVRPEGMPPLVLEESDAPMNRGSLTVTFGALFLKMKELEARIAKLEEDKNK